MEEKIIELLKKNLELNKEIYKMVKGIRHYVFWQRVWGALKLILILTPIILGAIYLPKFLSELNEKYSSLLNIANNPIENLINSSTNGIDLNSIDINSLSPELKKIIK